MSHTTLVRQTIDTPLGAMVAVTADRGIVLFDYADTLATSGVSGIGGDGDTYGLHRHLTGDGNDGTLVIIDGIHPFLTQLAVEISEYFAGTRRKFSVPLYPVGTPFQLQVWSALRRIPYGTTCSYADQAKAIGRSSAVRAVANANGHNRLPILIPCHRVIGTNGTLTGYSGGIDRKTELLKLERISVL